MCHLLYAQATVTTYISTQKFLRTHTIVSKKKWTVFQWHLRSQEAPLTWHPKQIGSKGFCRQKCHFSFIKKCKFRQKFCHKFQILPVFRHSKMKPFQQCITVTAVNLIYEVLPKQCEAFGFYFSQEKKVTAEYWVSCTVGLFAWNHTVSWQIINHYILECHMVKLMT